MNGTDAGTARANVVPWFIAVAGALTLVGGLAWMVSQKTQAPGIDLERAQLRASNLVELQAENQAAMTRYGWVDARRGIVRLPVSRALELAVVLWQDPAAGRSNLLARLEKATAKPPAQPNPYE